MGAPHRAAAAAAAAMLTVALTPGTVVAAPDARLKKIKAGSWIIADADTGEVLAAHNPHRRLLPASTQKVLTAVALIPRLGDTTMIQPTRESVEPEGTKVGMTPKLTYSSGDLFRALLMVSANDAAMTLTLPQGGMEPTLKLMNAEAERLGAADTLAGSPNGLDVDLGLNVKTQYTTSYDLALILREGLKIPGFVEYASTVNAKFPALRPAKVDKKTKKKIPAKRYMMPIYSHIRMLPGESRPYKGFIAGKNGYTNAARQTFVGAAERDGRRLIIALMKGESLWDNAETLFDWGFANAGKVEPVETLVAPVPSASQKPSASPQSAAQAGSKEKESDSKDLLLGAIGGGFILAGVAVLLFRRRPAPAE
ncbi:D-alanyl-D-alanine carboxypeptidase [Actinocorallia sp. B10E7]|uniref:D-alanyl-D-alanine carboxypeptidase family protein n=1 Tax=Actinocorallia sp. B10E7 TaxID=3153558 RepID=UPI00325E1B89